MPNNYLKLEAAMDLIKEDLIRDLSESVIEAEKKRGNVFKEISFSERQKD